MLFNSYEFLVLLPFGLLVFYGAGWIGWSKAKIPILLALSIGFYTRSLGSYWYVLFFSIFCNFLIGKHILASLRGGKDARAKWAMRLGVAGNLALLGYFKYAIFVEGLFGVQSAAAVNIIPLGISFYTFTQIAFLIDASRGEVKDIDLVEYSSFVTYFPHLIAGPIIHHRDVIPQFYQIGSNAKPAPNSSTIGLALLSIGLFKKTVIADSLGPLVAPVFDHHLAGLAFSDYWLAALAYAMQLYFDFSAYSDMALGISLLFGIRLPVNFLSPYKATSIIDFWRRWHISLSNFLRDYVYFSLGGNRKSRARKYLNIFLTMLIGGVWHGSGFTFIIWGALHGLLILLNHAWRDFFQGLTLLPRWMKFLARPLCWVATFLLVVIAWVFFRSPDVNAAVGFLGHMASPSLDLPVNSEGGDWIIVGCACAVAWLLPNAYEIVGWGHWENDPKAENSDPLLRLRRSRFYPIAFGVLFGIAILFIQRRSEFLYWQF
jgi:alginate O-acetyltransferase complex protein AlgI